MGRGKEWQVKWWPGVYERLGVLPACRGGQRGCVRSSTCQRLALAPPINVLPGPGKSMLPRPRPRQGLVFFLGREVPREQLLFVIRSFGGEAAWDGEGSPFAEAHEGVTHQVGGRVARRAGGRLLLALARLLSLALGASFLTWGSARPAQGASVQMHGCTRAQGHDAHHRDGGCWVRPGHLLSLACATGLRLLGPLWDAVLCRQGWVILHRQAHHIAQL